MKRLRRCCCVVLLAILPLCLEAAAAPEQAGEYDIKAAMLIKLASFVHWPKEAASEQQQNGADSEGDAAGAAAFKICVAGENPFGQILENLAQHSNQERPIQVKQSDVSGTPACNEVFISASEKNRLEELLAQLKGKPVLTVSDIAGFAEAGGMIELEMQERKISLRINKDAIEEAGLSASSKLLTLARVVTYDKGKGQP